MSWTRSPSASQTSICRWAPVPRSTMSTTPSSSASQPSSAAWSAKLLDEARGPSPAAATCSPARKSTSSPVDAAAARRGPCCRRSARSGTRPAARRRRTAALRRWASETVSAASATVCSTRVCWSKTRVSTVPRFGMRAHVPPQVGVVLDRPGAHHQLDPVRVDLPGRRSAAGSPRAGSARKIGVREDISPVALARARTASSPTARAAAAGSGASRRRRRSPGRRPRSRRGRGCRRSAPGGR